MPRNKVKDSVLPVETAMAINTEFDKLMQFHDMSGLSMERNAFYAVVRGDEALPADVTAVELAYANVLQLNAMTNKELVSAAQRHINTGLFEREPQMRRYLQILVGKLMFS